MKKAKLEDGSNSMDRISELPQVILHRILYFLSQKEAVRTSVLSKSWRNIWCTRPNLDFSDKTFKGSKQDFISLVNNTLQRYCDQKLCVEEFGLCISLDDSVLLLERWIATLTNMGMKKLCLSIICSQHSSEFIDHLPSVVYEVAESLQDLHVVKFTLDQKSSQRTVFSKHPKKINLQKVYIEDEILEKIISSCPLVETVSIKSCKGLRNIEVKNNLGHLKNFSFDKTHLEDDEQHSSIEIINPSSLETISIDFGNFRFHKGADFRNLSDLSLFHVELSWDQLSWCKFPSLKCFGICQCDGLKKINNLFVDAPNIVCFQYIGDFIPSISFTPTTSREWHSYLGLTFRPDDGSSLFLKLKELLNSLSQSKIYLRIISHEMNDEDQIQERINLIQENAGHKRSFVVESLNLCCHLSSLSSLLIGVLSICHPTKIGAYGLRSERGLIEGLRKILMQRESGDQLDDQLRQLWLHDLVEVCMEINDMNRVGWHPITMSELSSYQETGSDDHIRFALKWRDNYVL